MNATDTLQRTALHLAAGASFGGFSHPSGVELLIARGALVNARDSTGRTPLQYAAANPAADGRTVVPLMAAGALIGGAEGGPALIDELLAAAAARGGRTLSAIA